MLNVLNLVYKYGSKKFQHDALAFFFIFFFLMKLFDVISDILIYFRQCCRSFSINFSQPRSNRVDYREFCMPSGMYTKTLSVKHYL